MLEQQYRIILNGYIELGRTTSYPQAQAQIRWFFKRRFPKDSIMILPLYL